MEQGDRIFASLAFAGLLVLGACGADEAPPVVGSTPTPSPTPTPAPAPSPTPPPSVERNIPPAETNPAINTNLSAHFVINPDPQGAAKNRLFVMLPGTFAVPRTYRLIVRTGAAQGYHAIGLTYPNDETVGGLCGGSSDPACSENVGREIITGSDTSSLVAVDPANSITGRLVALLEFLDARFPGEGWGRYLDNDEPDWDLITVAGHSQGGRHAGFLAKLVLLDRAVMFSAPGESGVGGTGPVAWTGLANVTPAERQYGFTHTQDNLVPLANATRNWAAIGLDAFGPPFDVDGETPPFENARQLITSAAPNPDPTGPSASPNHGAPVVDAVTPLDAQGRPLFEPVWIYLAFP